MFTMINSKMLTVFNFYMQLCHEEQKKNCLKTASFSVFYISNGYKLILQNVNIQQQDLEQVLLKKGRYTNDVYSVIIR